MGRETCIKDELSIEFISHCFVPQNYVEEFKEYFKNNGLNIVVLPQGKVQSKFNGIDAFKECKGKKFECSTIDGKSYKGIIKNVQTNPYYPRISLETENGTKNINLFELRSWKIVED